MKGSKTTKKIGEDSRLKSTEKNKRPRILHLPETALVFGHSKRHREGLSGSRLLKKSLFLAPTHKSKNLKKNAGVGVTNVGTTAGLVKIGSS